MSHPTSIPGIVEVEVFRGAAAGLVPDLVIEIPHGATRDADYLALERRLTSPLPASLIDFFRVNTDAGAPELGAAVARKLVAADATQHVLVLRCLVPRTFIDCNRRIDASPEEFREGRVTPGLMPWIVTAEDRALLRERYEGYVGAVRRASSGLGPRGAMLMLHTYAPRSVDVEVDADIVASMRRAYEPGMVETWPLRPDVDVIGRDIDGASLAPAAVVEALRESFGAMGLMIGDSATYPLHPSTLAWEHVLAHPGRALCIEFRRDLLADPFDPFAEMRISSAQVERLAEPLALALRRWWTTE